MKAKTTEQLEKLLSEAGNLQGSDLSGGVFENVDISFVDLKRIDAKGAKFVNCVLECAEFDWSDFSDALFVNCKMSGADFVGCNIERTMLEDCEVHEKTYSRPLKGLDTYNFD